MDRGLRYRCGIESANDVLWMSDLCCNGDESSILECPGAQLGLFRSECAGKGFAAVACLSEVKRIHVYRIFGRVPILFNSFFLSVSLSSFSLSLFLSLSLFPDTA